MGPTYKILVIAMDASKMLDYFAQIPELNIVAEPIRADV